MFASLSKVTAAAIASVLAMSAFALTTTMPAGAETTAVVGTDC